MGYGSANLAQMNEAPPLSVKLLRHQRARDEGWCRIRASQKVGFSGGGAAEASRWYKVLKNSRSDITSITCVRRSARAREPVSPDV